jgi:hypothetical protein
VHRRTNLKRWTALATSLATILVLAGSAPAFAGNTRVVTVGSAADGQLPSVTVSAGESVIFPLTVKNTGRQTLNNVLLVVGKDGWDQVEANPQTTFVPQTPIGLPPGVTISDSGTGGTTATGDPKCVGGQTLTCTIGSLAARASFPITVTISSTETAVTAAVVIPTKAVVTVAEIGNDHGDNIDTFAAEGVLTLLPFSCDNTSAFRTHDQSKVVSTCAVTDPLDANGQSASIGLPANVSAISLNDNVGQQCPAALVTCYGPTAVEADITGDSTSDTIKWVIDVELATGTNVNVYKVVVYHESDPAAGQTVGDITLIPLTKKNACKNDTQTNCGFAEIVVEDGITILRVTFQTAGNGKARV